jgi:hypothetical protein
LQRRLADWSRDVPSKKTLNKENLEALGVQRLVELLIELRTGNAPVKRRLRLELASTHSPGEVARTLANGWRPLRDLDLLSTGKIERR